jgi:hypothetical protein
MRCVKAMFSGGILRFALFSTTNQNEFLLVPDSQEKPELNNMFRCFTGR